MIQTTFLKQKREKKKKERKTEASPQFHQESSKTLIKSMQGGDLCQ
jgi:hypothetical protein